MSKEVMVIYRSSVRWSRDYKIPIISILWDY